MEDSIGQGDRESREARRLHLVPTTSVPAGHKVVGTRSVFKIQADSTYKSRLVVIGLLRILGVDCGGTFAPVCKLHSIRMMLAITAGLDYEVGMLDVQAKCLNADVEEDVFVKMAPGYETNDETGVPLVMKLKKSLYGLRQSPTKLVRHDRRRARRH